MSVLSRNICIAFVMAACGTACTTSRVIENTRVPEVEIDTSGTIWMNNRRVELGKIGKTLRSTGFRREQEVNILIPEDPDRRLMQAVSADLVRSGFTRSAFIKAKSATSATVPKTP